MAHSLYFVGPLVMCLVSIELFLTMGQLQPLTFAFYVSAFFRSLYLRDKNLALLLMLKMHLGAWLSGTVYFLLIWIELTYIRMQDYFKPKKLIRDGRLPETLSDNVRVAVRHVRILWCKCLESEFISTIWPIMIYEYKVLSLLQAMNILSSDCTY